MGRDMFLGAKTFNQSLAMWNAMKSTDIFGMYWHCPLAREKKWAPSWHFPMVARSLLKKSKIWGTVFTATEWMLTFRIIPRSSSKVYTSVVRLTWTMHNYGKLGDRYAGVFFPPNSRD